MPRLAHGWIAANKVATLAPDKVARKFARPTIYAWKDIRQSWGAREI